MTRGRKRKTADQLKIHGTFREDRHAARDSAPKPSGRPERPASLTGDAATHWDFVVNQLAELGVVTELDTMALQTASEMWALYRTTLAAALLNPIDKDLRISVLGYKTAWETSAAKLGLNPTDRQRLRVSKTEPEDFDAFMSQHG